MNNENCNNCIHRHVCGFKETFQNAVERIEDLVSGYSDYVNVEITCPNHMTLRDLEFESIL